MNKAPRGVRGAFLFSLIAHDSYLRDHALGALFAACAAAWLAA